jgi:hypothetical protein
MTTPMIAEQILHFKGGGLGMTQARHPPFVTLEPKACRAQLFQGLTFYVKIGTLGE